MTNIHIGRIAGIDYGTVRIGIATADLDVGIASPYETYTRRSLALDAEYFRTLAKEERLLKFVVGLPVHTSGHDSQKSQEARQFGQWLAELTQLPVEYFDERYTSLEAEQILSQANFTKKRRKARIDQLAAQIMLSAYLEAGAKGQVSPEGLD
jgi:putative Holliday junction resolvase